MKAKCLTAVLIVSVSFITVNKSYAWPLPPIADLEAVPQYVLVGQSVTLDGSDSSDPDGGSITKYEWDFTNNGSYDYYETSSYHPDGAFDGKTTYIYDVDDTYTVKLRVTDDESQTDTTTCTVYAVRVKNITQGTFYNSIQLAINYANNGDTIVAYKGTYYEAIDFNGVSCTLRSSDPNDWDVAAATVIDANDPNTAVATFDSGEDATSVLTGFTLTGGSSGISCSNSSSPTITRCIIEDNSSDGIYCISGSPQITNNIIRLNDYDGIYSSSSTPPTIKSNWIYDNYDGIGFSSANSSATARNNTIVDNDSNGIYVDSGTAPMISNCILWNNGDELVNCTATYSCIKDPNDANGTGNISSYPYFADYDGNDFHLTWNSPCINRGDPNGSYSGQVDMDGEDRLIDGRVDIGADEMNNNVNLLQNPGFEDGNDANGFPLNWYDYLASLSKSLDTNDPHSGSYSWKFANNDWGGYYSAGCSDLIPVEHDIAYELSGWVKCDDGNENVRIQWYEYDGDGNSAGQSWYNRMLGMESPKTWTEYSHKSMVPKKATKYVRLILVGPHRTKGAVWWDDFRWTEIGTEFLPAYGCVNEPNVAATVEFGGTEKNTSWVTDMNAVGAKATDSNDGNIKYRELTAGKTLTIEFPAFNLDDGYDPNDPNDPNSFPLTPMLLEIMYKDTTSYTSRVVVKSKIDYINLDPNYYGATPTSSRDYDIGHLGGYNDKRWKYLQCAFQKSNYQLLRAINNKFTIKISDYGTTMPIDYISLRKITQDKYETLTERQRDLNHFLEAELPADEPNDPNYADPNLTVFVRDPMRPVYLHTKPGPNEVDANIVGFSTWDQIEPLTFAIYSLNGVDDLTMTVSDLTHISDDSNSVIDDADISISHVVYDEVRDLWDIGYALYPERLEEFETLSVDPNTSERFCLKIDVPDKDEGLSAGIYEGQVTIESDTEPNKTVDIEFDVLDFELTDANHLNVVMYDPFSLYKYNATLDEAFRTYTEPGFEAFICPSGYSIVPKDPNDPNDPPPIDPCNIVFDSNNFKEAFDRMIDEGFVKDTLAMWTADYHWISKVYKLVTGSDYSRSDPNLYYNLSDPNFQKGFGLLIEEYCKIAAANDVNFIFFPVDEPGGWTAGWILCDRLCTIVKDANFVDPNYGVKTMVTYSDDCDANRPSGSYNVPFGDGNLPPLTDLIDYKAWAPGNIGYGYSRHNDPNDPNYPGYFGYYTTFLSHSSDPVHNRALHGLYAFGTGAQVVYAWAMHSFNNDPYNDFDLTAGGSFQISYTYWDIILAYPSWSGKTVPIVGGVEAVREGVKDAKYIATLQNLINEDPNDLNAIKAQDYLDKIRGRINKAGYSGSTILSDISDTNDPDDYEAFTTIRDKVADHIILLDPNS